MEVLAKISGSGIGRKEGINKKHCGRMERQKTQLEIGKKNMPKALVFNVDKNN